MRRFEEAINSERGKAIVDADMAEGNTLGGPFGTPSFFINGRYLSGAKPFDEFARVIDEELTRLNIPIPSSASRRRQGG